MQPTYALAPADIKLLQVPTLLRNHLCAPTMKIKSTSQS